MTAREQILESIRQALPVPASDPHAAHALVARDYHRSGSLARAACLDLFLDRLLDYGAEVIQVGSEIELPGAIAQALRAAAESEAILAPEFPQSWLPEHIFFRRDDHLSTAEIEGSPAVITTCEVAVAASGTILLVHDGAQGRRVLTLLPDHHVCLVRRDQVVELLPEALARLPGHTTRPITTISGPSATSDIEMTRIRGVHGPRRLTVLLYGSQQETP